jgi:CheY-like chemotaxis protein
MGMPRPTFLVAETEPEQALSVRKLVLETAKYNVVTAHSTREAMDLVELFPKMSAAILVLDSAIDCDQIARSIKGKNKDMPIIALSPRIGQRCNWADHTISSHEPEQLVLLMRSLVGDPRPDHGEKII